MRCAWKELLQLLPPGIRQEVAQMENAPLEELRLRLGAPGELVGNGSSRWTKERVTRQTLHYCVNVASQYSPWAAATGALGYLTAPGGHRIGLCGRTVEKGGSVCGLEEVTSLCIRVARDVPGIARGAGSLAGSVLILGPPGWGKTTLLRDLSRERAATETVCVVDERGELFPEGFARGIRMDVLANCRKVQGIPMALRTMSPQVIAVDEITDGADAHALIDAANCGVTLLATAHGADLHDLRRRSVYREVLQAKIFDYVLILNRNKGYRWERLDV